MEIKQTKNKLHEYILIRINWQEYIWWGW